MNMNTVDPLPSVQHIIETRWYGGCLGRLPLHLDDCSRDSLYLARIPNSDQVTEVMQGMIKNKAERHVHKDILLSGIDEPRHMIAATYGGDSFAYDLTTFVNKAEKPLLGSSGIIATLENQLVFCCRGTTYPIQEGMCFWGWIGIKDRVAWKQQDGILRDTSGLSALPHDAGFEAVECWKRMENDWVNQHGVKKIQQHDPLGGVICFNADFVPIRITDGVNGNILMTSGLFGW